MEPPSRAGVHQSLAVVRLPRAVGGGRSLVLWLLSHLSLPWPDHPRPDPTPREVSSFAPSPSPQPSVTNWWSKTHLFGLPYFFKISISLLLFKNDLMSFKNPEFQFLLTNKKIWQH